MVLKPRIMWAIPFNRADLRGTLDVDVSGAWAIFSTAEMARTCALDSVGTCEPIKVRVTIQRVGKRKNIISVASDELPTTGSVNGCACADLAGVLTQGSEEYTE